MGSGFTNFHAGCHDPVPLETAICPEDARLAPSATGVGRDRVTLELTGCGDLSWVVFPGPQESREDRPCDVQLFRPLGEDT